MSQHPTSSPLPQHILGIWPHPDDECYLSAGLMARMADTGRGVTVLTATRGEKGTSDPADYDQRHFAAAREQELRTSLATLGVHDLRFLAMRDGECDLEHDEEAIGSIAAVMEDVGADMVITFGPDGITGHPDHRMVSRWVTEAWRRTGRRSELLYATMTNGFLHRHATLHDEIGIFSEFGDGTGFSVADRDVAFSAVLSEGELDRKRRALAAHGGQTDGLAELMGEQAYRRWWAAERFRRPTAEELSQCQLVVRPGTNVAVAA